MLKNNISRDISPEDVVLIDLDGVKKSYPEEKLSEPPTDEKEGERNLQITNTYAPMVNIQAQPRKSVLSRIFKPKIMHNLPEPVERLAYKIITNEQAMAIECARTLYFMVPYINGNKTLYEPLMMWLKNKVMQPLNIKKGINGLPYRRVTLDKDEMKKLAENIPTIEQQLEIFEKYEQLLIEDSSIDPGLDIFFKEGIVEKDNARDASDVISRLNQKIQELSADNNAEAGNNHNNGM